MLILVNGAPGVGKSTLAERYTEAHRLALVIEIDDLRRRLGQWYCVEESKVVARDLAVALAREHLKGGHDVLIAQYIGDPGFIERLSSVARDAAMPFVEVVLTDQHDRLVDRFRRRRSEFAQTGVRHPEADLSDDAVDVAIRTADDRLRARASATGVRVIDTYVVEFDAAYEALCESIASGRRD